MFLHIGFIGCLVLQRFGHVFGHSILFVSLPIMAIALFWLLMTGLARFRTSATVHFMAFLGSVALSSAIAFAYPDNRTSLSLLSPVGLIANYMFLTLEPTKRFDTSRSIEIFLFYAWICAIGGIAQYILQFGGIRFFSFTNALGFLKPILVENRFNYDPILRYGSSIRRANGLFLLEPSMFSQIIVLAVCLEFFVLQRVKYIPVYALAYLVSRSGTGALCLALAIPFYMIFFAQQAGRLFLFGAIGIVLALGVGMAFPSEFNALINRLSEFTTPGTSGYARYVSQFEVVDVVIDEFRAIVGYGPGATDRADFYVFGSGGVIQKLLIDYGVIGFLAFFTLFIGAIWRRDLGIAPLLLIMIFLFGGGNLLMSPFIALTMLICIWSDPPKPAAAPRSAGGSEEAGPS